MIAENIYPYLTPSPLSAYLVSANEILLSRVRALLVNNPTYKNSALVLGDSCGVQIPVVPFETASPVVLYLLVLGQSAELRVFEKHTVATSSKSESHQRVHINLENTTRHNADPTDLICDYAIALGQAIHAGTEQILRSTEGHLLTRRTGGGSQLDIQLVYSKVGELNAWVDVLKNAKNNLLETRSQHRYSAGLIAMLVQRCAWIVDECVQLSGGYGYMRNNAVAAFYQHIYSLRGLIRDLDSLLSASFGKNKSNMLAGHLKNQESELIQGYLKELMPIAAALRETECIPREIFAGFGRKGLLSFAVDETKLRWKNNGLMRNMELTQELINKDMFGVAVSMMLVANTVIPILARYASDEIKRNYLIDIMAGNIIPCLAVSETGSAGSMIQSLRTAARPIPGGWEITGEKSYITNAPIADVCLVLARTSSTSSADDFSLFFVPTSTVGLSMAEKYQKLGTHESETGRLVFNNCVVKSDAVIGSVGSGMAYVFDYIVEERVLIAYAATLLARQCISRTRDLMQKDCKDELDRMEREIEVLEARCWQTAENRNKGHLISAEAAFLKYLCGDAVRRIAEQCENTLLSHYKMRTAEKVWFENLRLNARVTSIFTGASDVMRDFHGRRVAAGIKNRVSD